MKLLSNEIKEILVAAANVVLLRHGDVNMDNGIFATVDTDALLRLDHALAEHFKLDSDDVTFENIDDLITKISAIEDYKAQEEKLNMHDTLLKTITDAQVNAVVRSFWRRIYPYRNNYEKELPDKLPVELKAFMTTALTWADKTAQQAEIDNLKRERDILGSKLQAIKKAYPTLRPPIGSNDFVSVEDMLSDSPVAQTSDVPNTPMDCNKCRYYAKANRACLINVDLRAGLAGICTHGKPYADNCPSQEVTSRSIKDFNFININRGLYDDTMKCPRCEFTYENRVDNSFDENAKNSTHACRG